MRSLKSACSTATPYVPSTWRSASRTFSSRVSAWARAIRWVSTSVSVSERKTTPSAVSRVRSSEALSMIPLWTTATLFSASMWGWAFSSLGAPWVAQRVWAMPVVKA